MTHLPLKISASAIIVILTSIAYAEKAYLVQDSTDNLEMTRSIFGKQAIESRNKNTYLEKGYNDKFSDNAKLLLQYKNKKAFKDFTESEDPYFHLRPNTISFNLSFDFSKLSSILEDNILGYAPSGSNDNDIWTGFTSYFIDHELGVCRHAVFDFAASTGKAFYDRNQTTYDVNGKPTTIYAEGNDESGFFYKVSWTGSRYNKFINCANNKPFDPSGLSKLKRLAVKLDKEVQDGS